MLTKSAEKALSSLGYEGAELSVLITGDRRMRILNREFRGMDRTTDVLSFSMLEPGQGGGGGKIKAARQSAKAASSQNGPPVALGDVVISAPKAAAQAREAGHATFDEMLFLLVHGMLHLIGYDHEAGESERRKMERKQKALLTMLKAR
jgi:probable rRNA maturation factor